MNLKSDIINEAYSRLKISGITITPGPRDNKLALGRLEKLAARWKSKNIDVGYNFEENPDINSSSGIPLEHQNAFEIALAIDCCDDFGKQPPMTLMLSRNAAFSSLQAAVTKPRMTQYPSRMPLGRGNRRPYYTEDFYDKEELSPNDSSTNVMNIGDINDFTESFDSYIADSETVASFTITADTGLTIVSSSLSSPEVSYRIEAKMTGSSQIKIAATTSTGRISTRTIYFTVN